ncbi:MAG: septum formation initiator [Bacteroidetes bacterium HGW-Bacteroidetes-10]|jgi:cell division protein FtsB|nr:MAG: septum formation initiator [Bacteroidetes bacterium HGW-Bacteroidetes-10]
MWKKFTDSAFWRIIKNKFLIVTLAFVVWITFFDSNSLIKCSRVVSSINKQEKEKRYYKDEIKATEEKLLELSSNKDSLEKFAREQYIFHKDSEDVYIVVKKKAE